ncbi:Hypothetical predicted protein [Podarcis lilfordi]|uniref:Uncharacterized protein n=1 Tax=Podarcis lilfordi TaxID=74358 RepID=A0AA35KCD6_9SAUR|nr:Hypothetical predicted protein [Podarcis lilfordi]
MISFSVAGSRATEGPEATSSLRDRACYPGGGATTVSACAAFLVSCVSEATKNPRATKTTGLFSKPHTAGKNLPFSPPPVPPPFLAKVRRGGKGCILAASTLQPRPAPTFPCPFLTVFVIIFYIFLVPGNTESHWRQIKKKTLASFKQGPFGPELGVARAPIPPADTTLALAAYRSTSNSCMDAQFLLHHQQLSTSTSWVSSPPDTCSALIDRGWGGGGLPFGFKGPALTG